LDPGPSFTTKVSDTRRTAVNEWFAHTLLSRLNDKFNGCIILIMQRLHEDDLTGHLLKTGGWKMLRLPAIAEKQESHEWVNLMGVRKSFTRQCGEALHVEREPLSVLEEIRKNMGSYNFEGQYQQSPAPPGGGMVRQDWFRRYAAPPAKFDSIFQSWDTANKMSELNDFSVCTTWGVVGKNLYLLNVLRKRLEYPDLKRAVCSQAQAFSAVTVLIEDKASGTQLIQELKREDLCNVRGYNSTLDKQMRLVSVTSTIENGFVYLPEKAAWLDDYLHEMILFPRGNFDDQVDSTSQALLWIRENRHPYGLLAWYEALASKTAVSEMQERLFTRRYI
jgi:predicted phage terminase large subunit-like protein